MDDQQLDEIIDKATDWHGFYSEAMALLPEETRQFVDTTSWAGEQHLAKRKELIKAALIDWRNTQLKAAIPEKKTTTFHTDAHIDVTDSEAVGYNKAVDDMERNLERS